MTMRKVIALLGTAALFSGGYVVVKAYSEEIPNRLRQGVVAELERALIVGVEVEMDGRKAVLRGQVPDHTVRGRAIDRVIAVAGVADVDHSQLLVHAPDRGPVDPATVPPAAKTALTVTWKDGALSIAGQVVGAAVDERIDQKVSQAFAGARVAKRLEVAGGDADDDLIKLVIVGLDALSQTTFGSLRVADDDLGISGEAANEATVRAITESLRGQATRDVRLDIAVEVAAAPEVGPGDEVRRAGDEEAPEVADEPAPEADDDAEPAAPSEEEEEGDEAGDPPAGEGEPAEEGELEGGPDHPVEDDEVVVVTLDDDDDEPADPKGDEAAADEGASASPPHGVSLEADTPLPPEHCVDVLNWLVEGERRVAFDARNRLTPESVERLGVAASIIARCPEDAVFLIEGYTDSQSEPNKLRILSRRWALTTRNQLVALGVDADRLKYTGYGHLRPRHPNTRAARHLNNRVEFTIEDAGNTGGN